MLKKFCHNILRFFDKNRIIIILIEMVAVWFKTISYIY